MRQPVMLILALAKVTPQRLPKLGRAPGPDWLAIRAIARSAWLHGWLRAYPLEARQRPRDGAALAEPLANCERCNTSKRRDGTATGLPTSPDHYKFHSCLSSKYLDYRHIWHLNIVKFIIFSIMLSR
jgi:hypothetical protein